MRRFLPVLLLAAAVMSSTSRAADLTAAKAPDALPKIISLNMCADPYLMAFAEPEQILALSALSLDKAMSPFHQTVAQYPTTHGGIEQILALKPDVVIVSPYSSPMKQALLAQHGIAIVTLAASETFAASGAEILALGQAIGRREAAAAYWRQLQIDTQAASQTPRELSVLALQRRGLTAAHGHILAEIVAMAGAQLVTPSPRHDAGPPVALQSVNLEQAISTQADMLLLSRPLHKPRDRGDEFLTHPALEAKFPDDKRIYLDASLSVCTGAATPLAVRQLARALHAITP
jgi:iron complex transport system substrate-binding protein